MSRTRSHGASDATYLVLVDGRAGIGTASPLSLLHVESTGDIRAVVRNSTESTSYSSSLDYLTGSGSFSSANIVGRIVAVITQADPSALKGDLVFHTNAGDAVGERARLDSAGKLTLNMPLGGLGYGTGAGGAVTQATSKSTGVTINAVVGQITTHDAALAANTGVSFTVTNSAVAATDAIVVHRSSGGSAGAYDIRVDGVGAGSFAITVYNQTAGSLSQAITIGFAVIKGVTS